MTMTYIQFQKESMRTMPFGGKDFNFVEFHNILTNYVLGIVGEFAEFNVELNKVDVKEVPGMDLVNKIDKELGDTLHYLFGMLTIMEVEFQEEKLQKIESQMDIVQDLGNVAEIVKKHVFHGHSIDKNKLVDSVYRVISYIDTNFKYSISNILEKNIEKLKIRYPEKFSVEDSIARKDVE